MWQKHTKLVIFLQKTTNNIAKKGKEYDSQLPAKKYPSPIKTKKIVNSRTPLRDVA